jgi:hypothetical protein
MQHNNIIFRLENMKKTLLLTVIAGAACCYSCSGLIGNGKAIEESRTITRAYTGIRVESAIRVYLSDNVSEIHVRADELFIPFLETYVNDDNILVIEYSENMIGYSSVRTEVTVPCHPLLTSFEAFSASRIDATCDLFLSNVSFKASGASFLNFTGSAIDCEVNLSGASRFEGFDFTTVVLDCDLSGASRMEITCQGAMKVKASGASKVFYKGDCVITSIETSGGSEVTKK